MGSERRLITLSKLGRIITGKTPSTKIASYFGGTTPFITPRDMDGRKIIDTTERYLTEEGVKAVANAKIPAGSIMVSCIGSDMGKVVISGQESVTNQQINTIIVDSDYDAEYVYYNLRRRKKEFRNMAAGSAQPILNKNDFSQICIEIPPLPEQRAIAYILGTLDDKIELNRRMNETLEAVAQALFKSWFVDFDPVVVNAIKAGNPLPEKFAKRAAHYRENPDALGLPGHILCLFPDRFVDSELGPIPEGWEVKRIGDLLADLVSGSRPKGGAASSGIPSIGAENILGIGNYDFSKEKFIPEYHFEKMKAKGADVRQGDVLLYKDGAKIGRKTYFDCGFPHEKCAVNEHAFILRANNKALQRFIYFWLDLPWMTKKIVGLNANSAQPGINRQGVRSLPILVPNESVIVMFDGSAKHFTDKIFTNALESRTLAILRDTLLPKLISGELRVPDVEKILEESRL